MKKSILFCFVMSLFFFANAQRTEPLVLDTTGQILVKKNVEKLKDTTKKYNPNIAVRRSLILPGYGQFTNKKYWKIPIVYGALGTTAFIFFRNIKQYKESKEAFILATDGDNSNDFLIKQPYYNVRDQPERIRAFRNQVRQNVDYSVLFFLLFWGVNVADAAVDAHLKTFDVSDDLSLHIKAGYSPVAQTNGLSLVLNIGRDRSR